MVNKNILIFGNGLVASRLQETFNCPLVKDKNSFIYIDRLIKKYHPGIIINSTDYVGNNADACELNRDATLEKNVFFPITLAEAAIRNKIKLVHVSSGCLFHYNYKEAKLINENAEPDFFDLFYNRTIIYSDQVLARLADRFDILILRIRLPIDNRPHKRNLLTKLITFKKVIKQPNSVTYIPTFLKAVKHLIKIKARGIYNIVNTGGLYYPDLLESYKKYKPGLDYKVIDFNKLGIIRTNLILSNSKLKKSGFKIPHINEVLKECVENYIKY